MFASSMGDGTPQNPPLPSLDVIRQTGRPLMSLKHAIEIILFHDDEGPLFENPDFQKYIKATTNEASVTGLKGGDTWFAVRMLMDYAQERGSIYNVINSTVPARKLRDAMNAVLIAKGCGRNRS